MCTKLCVPVADVKSEYASFLKENPCDLKMTTFHGNRINLVFPHIIFCLFVFLCWSKKLAFGSIDKLITWSIWRIIENSNHILDLNEEWFNF